MKDRAIAFIDILGFTPLVASHSQEDILEIISPFFLCEKSNDDQRRLYEDISLNSLHSSEVSFFSDSLVISYNKKDVGKLIMNIHSLSEQLIRRRLFMRGGIACGQLFHQERIVFGKAMNEAYKLENKHAIYPRVILSKETYKLCLKHCTKPASDKEYLNLSGLNKVNEDLKPLRNIYRDTDGFYYVNPFPLYLGAVEYWRSVGILNFEDLVKHIKNTIEENLDKHSCDVATYKKYHWLANKFNTYYKEQNGIEAIEI